MKLFKSAFVTTAILIGITSCGGTKNDDNSMMLLGALALTQQTTADQTVVTMNVPEGEESNVTGSSSATTTASTSATTTAVNTATSSSTATSQSLIEKHAAAAFIREMEFRKSSPVQALADSSYNYNDTVNFSVTDAACFAYNFTSSSATTSGTYSMSGSANFEYTGQSSYYNASDYSSGSSSGNYNYRMTQFQANVAYTNCVVSAIDVSDPSKLTGNPLKWPIVYIKVNGDINLSSGTANAAYTYSSTSSYAVADNLTATTNSKSKSNHTSDSSVTVNTTGLATVTKPTAAEAETAVLGDAVAIDAVSDSNGTLTMDMSGKTTYQYTDDTYTKLTIRSSGSGGMSGSSTLTMKGTVNNKAFDFYLKLPFTITVKEMCEMSIENYINNPDVTYICE